MTIAGVRHCQIGPGVLIFVGVKTNDGRAGAAYLAERCANLRIFEDAEGKMNRSVLETKGSALVVSQFTLYGDTRKGNRPGFTEAAAPDSAQSLYEEFLRELQARIGEGNVATGVFRAAMEVQLVNDGPVTLMIESKD